MLELLWSTINISIFIYFIYLMIGLIIKGRTIFSKKVKTLSLLFLIIGCIQIFSESRKENTNEVLYIHKIEGKHSKIKEILLEKHFTFDIYMDLKYSIEKKKMIPMEAHSSLYGLVSGFNWKLQSISVQKNNYHVNGILTWSLFGFPVYKESKSFNPKI